MLRRTFIRMLASLPFVGFMFVDKECQHEKWTMAQDRKNGWHTNIECHNCGLKDDFYGRPKLQDSTEGKGFSIVDDTLTVWGKAVTWTVQRLPITGK